MKMNVQCRACVHCERSQNPIFDLVEDQIMLKNYETRRQILCWPNNRGVLYIKVNNYKNR